MSRSIRAGLAIKLRALFKDDLGQPVQASSVTLDIFEPDADIDNELEAIVQNAVPTYLGEGIFEYEYTVPSAGPEGAWTDRWSATINSQVIDGIFEFSVSADGTAFAVDQQFKNNNVIEVTLPATLAALDGSTLSSEYQFDFMTTIAPAYSSIRKVMLSAGGFFANLADDTIQTAILEASLEADVFNFTSSATNISMFEHARREYVTCLVGGMLLSNAGSQQLKAKTLADLHVEYDTSTVKDMLNDLMACQDRWLPQLMSGGGAKGAQAPSVAVKGALDYDRPVVSRMWQSTDTGVMSRRIPSANTKERPAYSRRGLRTYKKRQW